MNLNRSMDLDEARRELAFLETDLKSHESLVATREAALKTAAARGTAEEHSAARVRYEAALSMLEEHKLFISEQRRRVRYLELSSAATAAGF